MYGSPSYGATLKTAFVFQGGGSLSAPQVGMLRALVDWGITPDLVVGSSAGALNAVAFATDPTSRGVQRLRRLWLGLRRRDVAQLRRRNIVAALRGRRDGLFSSAPLARALARGAVASQLDATAIPAHVVATRLSTGEPVVLSTGATIPALLASSAFPGMFAPVSVAGERLIDGGVSADIPILSAEALGAETSYVLRAAVSDEPDGSVRGPVGMAYHALGLILDIAARREMAAARGSVQLLPTPSSPAAHPLDFRETERLIDEGYQLTQDWLAETRPTPVSGTGMAVGPAH